MDFLISFLLLGVHFLLGIIVLRFIFREQQLIINPIRICLAIMLGMVISTLLVFLVEFIPFIPVIRASILAVHAIFLLLGFFLIKRFDKLHFKWEKIDFNIADVVPIGIIVFFAGISVWRTFYYPPYSYDSMMGIDIIAKFVVRDGGIAQSDLFQNIIVRDGVYSNQLFYAPFTMLMQVMYRVLGVTFGQLWLGVLSMIFLLWFYFTARKHTHVFFATIAVLFLIFVPEFYAYSFILQTDYNNAIFFFVACYFFWRYYNESRNEYFVLSALFFGFACWSRTETLFFVPFGALALIVKELVTDKKIVLNKWIKPILLVVVSFLFVFVWNFVYVKLFLPRESSLTDQIQLVIGGFFSQFADNVTAMNQVVVFNELYWNYIVKGYIVFLVLGVIASALLKRKFTGWLFVFWVVVLYVVFNILIIQFPAVTVQNTFRRGFFKFMPLMTFFMAINSFSLFISEKLKWQPLTKD